MRIFVAGATGAIGRPLVGQLVEAGHEVTGTTRSAERAQELERAGARGVVCDALSAEPLARAVAEARPDVVIHQLTALPERFEPRKRNLYDETNRLRTVGTRNLLDAAKAAGARRFICQSIAFAYEPLGGATKDEGGALFLDAPEPFGSSVRVIKEMERAVLDAGEIDGVILRYGWFYGPGTYFATGGSTAEDVRRRRYPIVGDGSGLFSFIHVEDAAAATLAALERGNPGIYNIVDDEPVPMREWLTRYAETLGAKPPRRVPRWLARILAGKMVARMSTELRGASNAKARRELGWRPMWETWQEGLARAPR